GFFDGLAGLARPNERADDLGLTVALEELEHRLAHAIEIGSEPDEHLRGDALALPEQAQQDVLGPDVVVSELERLTERELEHLLRTPRERDVALRRALAPPDDHLDLPADRLGSDRELVERPCGDAVALCDQPEQQVLGADVVVVEDPSLLLCEHHGPPGSI